MSITHLNDLIRAAAAQPDPQRLLFVFTARELPTEGTAEQIQTAEKGVGGYLTPLACVDKTPEELSEGYQQLYAEADRIVPEWSIVFAGAIGGQQPVAPTSEEAQAPLDQMIEMIKLGRVAHLNAFNRQGEALLLHATTEYETFEPVLMNKPK